MAAVNDLIQQIKDKNLRECLQQEMTHLSEQKKFGLVFENHYPEYTPLYNVAVRKGSLVAIKGTDIGYVYSVSSVSGEMAIIKNNTTGEKSEHPLNSLIVVARFGEPIFPSLIPIDKVENAPDSSLWHTLIEAENFHALQLLEYLYPKQVDCIYIDPPYNTGARDWKYNNDYVDASDSYRHSKWLSMMKRRLKIAKRLLKPDGVFIIAIDKNEIAHLVCLLEESDMFPDMDITIVSVVHNPRGNITLNFAETNEYVVYLTPKNIRALARSEADNDKPRKLRRWGHFSLREERRTMFYPIYVRDNRVVGIGDQPEDDFHPLARNIRLENGDIEVWPIDQDGIERRWNYSHEEIPAHFERIIPLLKDGEIDLFLTSELSPPKTVWMSPELDSGGVHGSTFVEKVVGTKFPYPKSLYTVVRSIEAVIKNKPNALIVDFFAGSGTTMNAVNLINQQDGGHRRCILVTNNEVSYVEATALKSKGLCPGDAEWESQGICRSITWPRNKYTILGVHADGSSLDGEYTTSIKCEIEHKRAIKKIDFVDSSALNTIAKKKQFISLLGKEKLAQSLVQADSRYIVSEKYPTTILFDDSAADEWIAQLKGQDHIREIYIVTQNSRFFRETKVRVEDVLGQYSSFEPVKIPLKNGFTANAEYFKLGFLDKSSVELGASFKSIIPMLWLQSGAVGKCPELSDEDLPEIFIPESSSFAVLLEEYAFSDFIQMLSTNPNITYAYIVTNSQITFREMASQLTVPTVKQLYRDYIDNFTINARRNNI